MYSSSICARSAASGRRPSAGTRIDHLRKRQVQPCHGTIGQHQRPVVRLDERAAARGHDDVPNRHQLAERHALQLPEIGLSLLRENRGHAAVLPGLDALVDVFHAPAGALAQGTGHRASCPPP